MEVSLQHWQEIVCCKGEGPAICCVHVIPLAMFYADAVLLSTFPMVTYIWLLS